MGDMTQHCCCGCCTLQTGTKIICWLSIICGLTNIVRGTMCAEFTTGVTEFNILIAVIILSAIWIVVTVPVLISALKNGSPGLLLPWLIFNVIALPFGIGLGFYSSILLMQLNQISTGITYIFSIFLVTALIIYFWMVIYSYYRQMKDQKPLTISDV
uniref:Uncharacterized protein n=1 Tax=Daphnia galeata TaxID=27404 RepID=A0A8J2RVU8_9CRUS|nr:unnamed protein product [Daphnia galeata]